MPTSDQAPWSEASYFGNIGIAEFPIEFYAGAVANHWPTPTFEQPLQPPLDEGLLDGTDQMPITFQSWQRPFGAMSAGVPANQVNYPALSQSFCSEMGHGEGGDLGYISALFGTPSYFTSDQMPSSLAPAHNHEVIADQSTIVPLSHANTAAIPNNQPPTLSPAHPITGRYHCSYPACAQDFKRPGDRLRHISSVHQRGQMNQGKNLCPIVGCRRSYGKGLCRPDKVNDHLRKIHGLVRVAPTGGSVAGGSSANGAGRAPAAASGTVALARNGN